MLKNSLRQATRSITIRSQNENHRFIGFADCLGKNELDGLETASARVCRRLGALSQQAVE